MNEPEMMPVFPAAAPDFAVKQERKFQPHDAVFALLALPLGVFFTRCCLFQSDGFAATAIFLLLLTGAAVYVRKSGQRAGAVQKLIFAVLCGFSAVFSLTANPLVRTLCAMFLFCGVLWWIQAVCSGVRFVTRWFAFDLLSAVIAQPLKSLGAAPEVLARTGKKSESVTKLRTVLLALLATVPLTCIVGALLASADEGVSDLLSKIGALLTDDVWTLVMQLVIGIPVGFWLFGALYAGFLRKEAGFPDDDTHADRCAGLRLIPNLGLLAGVTPICLLYLTYVISQTGYFLSAFAGRLPGDMIYSEYARRGFFELCAIAVINLFVLLIVNGCAKGGKTRALSVYVIMLCGFTLFIIATALAKMLLYIRAYGLTQLRMYTAWFMVLLGIVFFVLILRQLRAKFQTAAVLTAAFLAMFGLLCFSRPDALIAAYNIRRYEQGTLKELDVKMLCSLSDDAYAVMAQHTAAIASAGQYDYYERNCNSLLAAYEKHPDEQHNLSALLLTLRSAG